MPRRSETCDDRCPLSYSLSRRSRLPPMPQSRPSVYPTTILAYLSFCQHYFYPPTFMTAFPSISSRSPPIRSFAWSSEKHLFLLKLSFTSINVPYPSPRWRALIPSRPFLGNAANVQLSHCSLRLCNLRARPGKSVLASCLFPFHTLRFFLFL